MRKYLFVVWVWVAFALCWGGKPQLLETANANMIINPYRFGGESNPAMITTWELTVDDTAGRTITLPLRSGFTYDFEVDWGDGNSGTVTNYDDADRIHEYASTGTVTVSMTGTLEAWYFNNGGDKLKFKTVESWGDVEMTGLGLESAFYGCVNASGFADFTAMPVTSLKSTFFNCNTLVTSPSVVALSSVDSLYQTWFDCNSMTSGPDLSSMTNVTTMYRAFRDTALASVPSLPVASTALENVGTFMYQIGSGMTGTVVAVWNTNNFPNITLFGDAFTGATGLDNYADIPDAWKGL